MPAVQSTSGESILQVRKRNKEVSIASYLGLKLKYPGLQFDKTGSCDSWSVDINFSFLILGTLMDIKPDPETGFYTLVFRDVKQKRFTN